MGIEFNICMVLFLWSGIDLAIRELGNRAVDGRWSKFRIELVYFRVETYIVYYLTLL